MIYVLLILSFLIRLLGINQSLWLDEAISANIAKLPISQIVNSFSISDFHPPLYYWFLNIWIKMFGDGVVVMRLTSVIFSIITIWLVFLIGKEIKNKKYGFWAAIFVAINPLYIYYSQELRMYSMAVMFLTGLLYFGMKKTTTKNNWKNILGFNIMAFLAFFTYYGSVFFIAAFLVYLLFTKKFKILFYDSIGIILAVLLISPLLLIQIKNSGVMLDQVVNWSLVLGKVNFKNLILIPLKFSIGRISWYPKSSYYLVGGIWTLIVWGFIIKNIFKNKIIGSLLIVPIVLGIIFSIKSPLLQYFRFLYLIPLFSLLLTEIKNQKTKIFLFLGFSVFGLIYLLNPKMHREDWKSLVKDIENKPNIYMVSSFADPVKYYNSTIQIKDIKTSEPQEKEVVVIPYGAIIHGIDIKQKMNNLGYQQSEVKNFREIGLEFYKRR